MISAKVRNYLKLPMLNARVILALFALPLASSAWQADPSPSAPCLAVGEISGWDILERTLTLKSDSGHYSEVHYDDSTVFSDGGTTLAPENLSIDDRVCVSAFRDHSNSVASRLRDTRRSEIDARDRRDLLAWERDSVFGTVKSLDTRNHRMALRTPGGADVQIDAADPIAFWTLPAQTHDPAEVVPADWQKLTVGDEVYVHGDRAFTTGAIRARLVVSGGFRSFVGSVESMEPLNELLRLRDFRSGRSRSVHFDFMPIYIAGRAAGSADRHLYSGTIGDLKEGDSVLIMARQDGHTGHIDALLLITGFSRAGIAGPEPGQSPDWLFRAVGIGGQPISVRRP
jgi:Domain of unknown function (DUF5666)